MVSNAIAESLRDHVGAKLITDFGVLHQGKLGHTDCALSAGLEKWQGSYYMLIGVVLSRGNSMRKTSILKWPYSNTSATDLAGVIKDLEVLQSQMASQPKLDTRGWFGRLVDRAFRMQLVGEYRFTSSINESGPSASFVDSVIYKVGQDTQVTLWEYRQKGVRILAQFPHAGVADILRALHGYLQKSEKFAH